jgi:hypothetical protein
MATLIGADYSVGRPGGAALAAAGVKVVGRYAALGRTSVNITADEVKDLRAHGIDIFTYNEHTAGYMLEGAAAAARYVPGAVQVAKAAGLPDGPIFYSVDLDATLGGEPVSATALGNMAKLAEFLKAAAAATSWDQVGVYGGYYVVKWLLDNLPSLKHAVQTSAWSAGHWDPRAFCRQDGYNWKINGVDCDHLTVVNPDEGSLRYRRDTDMPVTEAEMDRIATKAADKVWAKMLDSRWHGRAMSAGDLLEYAAWYAIEAGYDGKRGANNPTPGTPTLAATLRSGVSGAATAESLKAVATTAAAQRAAIAAQLDPAKLADAFIAKLGGAGGTLTQAQVREAAAGAFAEQLAQVRLGVIDPNAPHA